jgi:hypothetical protein
VRAAAMSGRTASSTGSTTCAVGGRPSGGTTPVGGFHGRPGATGAEDAPAMDGKERLHPARASARQHRLIRIAARVAAFDPSRRNMVPTFYRFVTPMDRGANVAVWGDGVSPPSRARMRRIQRSNHAALAGLTSRWCGWERSAPAAV